MGNAGNDDEPFGIVDGVHDPVIAYANSEVVSPRELDCSRRARLGAESVDRSGNPSTERSLKPAVSPRRSRMKADFVSLGLYSRTSAQETAASRSSRA